MSYLKNGDFDFHAPVDSMGSRTTTTTTTTTTK